MSEIDSQEKAVNDRVGHKAASDDEAALTDNHLHLTDAEKIISKQVARKVDKRILPLVILVYLMNYIDRNNYAAARLQGLEKDLKLVGNQYQVGLSILFVGYILAQVPSNMLINYCGRPSWYLGGFTIVWGMVSALTSLVQNYSGIIACRFLLGFVESPFFAGVMFYLSKWYTKEEVGYRMSFFYSGSLISGAFGNLIAAGILHGLNGAGGKSAWRWLYIIEGTITIAIGIVVVFVLPDFPDTWRALSPEQKRVAMKRLALEAAEADVDISGFATQRKGLKQAMSDSKTYVLALAYLCVVTTSSFQNFFPTLTATLGLSNTISLVLVAPPYLFFCVYSWGHGIMSDRLQKRFWFFMYPLPITILGFIIFMVTDNFGARYFSFFLMVFIFAPTSTTFAWISASIPRPPAKRAVAVAFINAVGNAGSIFSPYFYTKDQSPYYRKANGANIAFACAAMIFGCIHRWQMGRENARIARLEEEDTPLSDKDMAILQKTAAIEGIDVETVVRQQKGFRYIL